MQIKSCRLCSHTKFVSIIELGDQVLTGRFPSNPEEKITTGPLNVVQCDPIDGCGLLQLEHSYDLEEMYGETYGYRSGLNAGMVRHLGEKVQNILKRFEVSDGDIILDVGSNDGTTLGFYPEGKFRLIGIDPSSAKFGKYYRQDIHKVADFFTANNFDAIFPGEKAKVITSFSMLYDLEEPVRFAKDISDSLEDNGIWCFEQSYMPAMLAANSFDTICHEHLEYYSLTQIDNILKRVGMHILDVSFNDVNGGSFSVYAGKKQGSHPINSKVINAVLEEEKQARYDTSAPFEAFRKRVEKERAALMDTLTSAKEAGKVVVGLGASTKGNVLLQYYGITTDLVSCVAEVNPDKYGCYTPGTNIPIRPQEEVFAENPDYLLVLPWHFRDFFEQSPNLKGYSLLYPLPNVELLAERP